MLALTSLARLCVQVEGCLVRIAEPQAGQRNYFTALITGAFEFRQSYAVAGSTTTTQGLLLQRACGRALTLRMHTVSNLGPRLDELAEIQKDVRQLKQTAPGSSLRLAGKAAELRSAMSKSAALAELSRAKALIDKWNSLNDRPKLRDAVTRHSALKQALKDEDWAAFGNDFDVFSRDSSDDEQVWSLLQAEPSNGKARVAF